MARGPHAGRVAASVPPPSTIARLCTQSFFFFTNEMLYHRLPPVDTFYNFARCAVPGAASALFSLSPLPTPRPPSRGCLFLYHA
ncbi:hypothetical protein LI328DRAFT_128809 [Trichoderma asperelloides]|nr:hypothetical protein LI328DRAFT_128809 [Trichoderma asperelloides]